MGEALEKYLHEQGDKQGEEQEADATATTANQPDAEPEPSLQESEHDLSQAVEALRAEVGGLARPAGGSRGLAGPRVGMP